MNCITFGTVSVLIARMNTGACYISALSCHTESCRANSVGNKTKSKGQDQDRGRSETGLVNS